MTPRPTRGTSLIVLTETPGSMVCMTQIERSKLVAVAVATTLTLAGGTAAVAATDSSSGAKKDERQDRREQRREAAQEQRQAAFAKALGVSTADVEKARAEVRADARQQRAERERARAEKQGVTVTELREKRADRLEKRLGKQVEAGRLTQEQADRIGALVRDGKGLKAARKAAKAQQRGERLP